jgi:hypothetical protein
MPKILNEPRIRGVRDSLYVNVLQLTHARPQTTLIFNTFRIGRVFRIFASYSEGLSLKYRPGDWLIEFCVVIHSYSREMPG